MHAWHKIQFHHAGVITDLMVVTADVGVQCELLSGPPLTSTPAHDDVQVSLGAVLEATIPPQTSTPNHDLISDSDTVEDPTAETEMSWSDITEEEVEDNPIECTWDQSIDELEEEIFGGC